MPGRPFVVGAMFGAMFTVLPAAMFAAAVPAGASSTVVVGEGGWSVGTVSTFAGSRANQGVTTTSDDGRREVLTRGSAGIPPALRNAGWTHVGDPDAVGGTIFDAYQGASDATAKLFTITTEDGRQRSYVHPLARGESYRNSFVTVAPGRKWFVSGEWGTEDRLLVFAVPPALAPGGRLPLAGVIRLAHPMRDVQGCDFASRTELVCSTNDPGTDLYPVPRQLLEVRLDHPLDGTPVVGRPVLVGSAPEQTVCSFGSGEVEGLDVTRGVLRIAINVPCSVATQVFAMTRTSRSGRPVDIDLVTRWARHAATASTISSVRVRFGPPRSVSPAGP